MTYLVNRQGLEEVLLCPGEAEEVSLMLSEIRASAEKKKKKNWLQIKKQNKQTQHQTDLAYMSWQYAPTVHFVHFIFYALAEYIL